MENKNYTAADAIRRSVSHNEIVTIDYTFQRHMPYQPTSTYVDLLWECEDHVDDGEYEDMWGTTPSGQEWRVHVLINRERR